MKKIAVINQKGGVGKSTTAAALGSGLARKGYSVLYIDLDAQGNLSYTLGADSLEGCTSMSVLMSPKTAEAAIQHVPQGDIIASSPDLAGADAILTHTGKEYRLREALERLQDRYDFCIIDTPPALGILTINALTACSGALIPSQADIFSLQGIVQLHSTISAVRKYCNTGLKIYGIVLTRYNSRAIISRDAARLISQSAEQIGTHVYETAIRECTAIKEAQATRKSIYDYAPKSNAATDYAALADEVLTDLNK